ncbi:MAG: hypothetical protein EOO59_08040 [Hymenobacter sp.]|nr:MAG: hypothetical protein EOO59_08040 [Hymenobacter sp.]
MTVLASSSLLAPAPTTRSARWAGRHPAVVATLLLLGLFLLYVYSEDFNDFQYDSDVYWQLAKLYWGPTGFDLLRYDNILRGYLFPLLLAPLVPVAEQYALLPMDLYRVFGAGMAAVLFGAVVPGLWHAARGPGSLALVPLGRRLLLGGLGFVFWRGYFNYPLSDFPALLALAGGVWVLLRSRSVGSGLLAGLLVAAAANIRPVYAAALPLVAVLFLWLRPVAGQQQPKRWAVVAREAALFAGLALVLWPQMAINRAHFGSGSPLVLTTLPNQPSLYLLQLQWGLRYKKYETSIGTDYAVPQMFFVDRRGQELWAGTGRGQLDSMAQYGRILRASPGGVLRTWASHLFNGLDLQYPTPYIARVYQRTWVLAWLNYTVLFGGLWVLCQRRSRWPLAASLRVGLVLLVVLGPCAATLPVAMECRFLLPLHLLLCAAFAFGVSPAAWYARSPRQRLGAGVLYVGFVLACFSLSLNTQSRLQLGGRSPFSNQLGTKNTP